MTENAQKLQHALNAAYQKQNIHVSQLVYPLYRLIAEEIPK